MTAEEWNDAAAKHATTALELYPDYPAKVQNAMFFVVVEAYKAGALAGLDRAEAIRREVTGK